MVGLRTLTRCTSISVAEVSYDLRQKESDMKVQELLPADVPDDGKHSSALYSFSMKSHILATSPSFSNVVDS